jgi:hypothetical protein
MIRDAVKPGQRGLGVAALAGGRARAAIGAVRAMASRAIERAAVRCLGLCGMTAGAARRLLTGSVGGVTARAGLVSARRRACLVAVAGRTRFGRRTRRVACVGVAAGARRVAGALRGRRAICMAAAAERRARDRLLPVRCVATAAGGVARSLGRLRAIGVAAGAGRRRRSRLAAVGDMAVEAWRRRVRGRRMTARARHGLRGRAKCGRVWRMASEARLPCPERGATACPGRNRMVDLLGVAAGAGARCIVVRRVAARALRVRLGGEHRTTGVAGRARLDLRCLEVMRCVAACARGVAGGLRRVHDAQRRRLLRVAARAALVRGGAGLVHAVTVDATARAGMPRLLLRVAFRARPGIQRRRSVRAMAASTRLVGVQAHRVHGALRLVVAPHARGGFSTLLAEGVAVLAGRRGSSAMQWRCDGRVAPFAQLGGRRCELAVAVAVGTRHLADVRRMARAVANVAVGDGHLVRCSLLTARAARRDRDEDEPAAHGFDPIG